MTEKTVPEVLRDAADHIEKVGWYQGRYFPLYMVTPVAERPCCAVGALGLVTGYFVDLHGGRYAASTDYHGSGGDLAHRAEVALTKQLRREGVLETVVYFNDSPGRTQQDVTRLMRAAADFEEQNQ